ncbi:MAG: hypothetical protein M3135_05430, partial [Actinomycetota bacterium]|nr:hypothetical protein [Actinomycetota bacterium]
GEDFASDDVESRVLAATTDIDVGAAVALGGVERVSGVNAPKRQGIRRLTALSGSWRSSAALLVAVPGDP